MFARFPAKLCATADAVGPPGTRAGPASGPLDERLFDDRLRPGREFLMFLRHYLVEGLVQHRVDQCLGVRLGVGSFDVRCGLLADRGDAPGADTSPQS